MLDAKSVVEAELITQLQLAPELLITLCRTETGFGPDMGKMREPQTAPLLFDGLVKIVSRRREERSGGRV